MSNNEYKKQNDALNAINMYNMICDLEDRMSMGEEPEGIDITAMMKAKELSKSIISNNLNVKVV